ncbi:MAG: hypothetical protein FWH11_01975 [Micrococcales bacterium]|nr:hypothetical protein [Micrococcales bacterium]
MPTTKPRYVVTDTAEVAAALDVAQRRWPDLSRSRALLRLVTVGAQRLDAEEETHAEAVRALSQFAGTYPEGYLDQLRAEWPQ